MGIRIGEGRLKDDQEVSGGLEDETQFVWDGSHLLQEKHLDGLYTYVYTDVDSYEPLAQIHDWANGVETKQNINYFHCDQIGIPREMTDRDGKLLWFGDYYGWGKLKGETNITNTHQPFRLQNQYCDEETGLHYNFFRYYEPNSGRFINQDPIGLVGGENFYTFALNAKAWIDPLGLAKGNNRGKQKGKEFRGGSKKQRDIWYGFDNKYFQRWYHRVGKKKYNDGEDIEDRSEVQRLFDIWEELGKSNVK